jgi:hypothetical protein
MVVMKRWETYKLMSRFQWLIAYKISNKASTGSIVVEIFEGKLCGTNGRADKFLGIREREMKRWISYLE